MNFPPSRLVAAGLVVPLLALAACGDDDSDAGGVEVSGAWARTSPMMAEAGAAYMQISAEETTAIVSASVDESVAGTVELHETVPAGHSDDDMEMGDDADMGDGEMGDDTEMGDGEMGDDADMGDGEMGDDTDMGDGEMDMGDGEMAMTMQQVESINLPAGETVSLEPGGLHVMMLDLPDPLEAGEEFDLTLTLENGEEVVVGVEVRDEAP